MRRIIIAVLLTLTFALASSSTEAHLRGWGPRFGMTVDPDQVHLGAHLDLGYLVSRLRMQPNFEMGLGDNVTLASVNFETAYMFSMSRDRWRPYAGGGLGINWYSWDHGSRFGTHTDARAGLSALGGIERHLGQNTRFFAEMKLGLIDAPDMKWTVGWTFQY